MDPTENLTGKQLQNVIDNHRRHRKTTEPAYLDALAEQARRKGKGLDFDKTFALVRAAAAERRFLSYKQLAEESGADWSKVRYAVDGHLGELIAYAHGKGWPLLSAIVVNQPNLATGTMEPATLKGFAAARDLGYTATDEEAFLREQQDRVFAWAEVAVDGEGEGA